MNDNIIDSIEWHKDQLSKLISENNFYKIESELDTILEKAKTKKKVLVHRGGKTFYREQEVGTEDKGSQINGLYNAFNDIKSKIEATVKSINKINAADIEPDIKEKKLKTLGNKQDKLKNNLNDLKSQIDTIKKKGEGTHEAAKTKVGSLESWMENHNKLQNKLDNLGGELKDIMSGKDPIDVRAKRLKAYKVDFANVKAKLKISSKEGKKLDKGDK